MQDFIILADSKMEDLTSEITQRVLAGIEKLLTESRQTDLHSKEWLTSKETETILKISSVTRWNWTKAGILRSYKISNRLRYRKDEVLAALLKIESKR
jgi:hypothetical protein